MKRKILTSIFVAALVLGCKEEQVNKNSAMDKSTENVFLKKWEGDYNGVPAFDEMELSQLKPAMQKSMKNMLIPALGLQISKAIHLLI